MEETNNEEIDHPIGCVDCGKEIASVRIKLNEEYKGNSFYSLRCETYEYGNSRIAND